MVFKGVDYFNIDELLSDEEKIVRDSVRAFLETEVEPLVIDAFDKEEPIDMKKLAPKMGKLSIIGAFIPEEYGGPGASYIDFGIICHELERVDGALRSFMAVQSGLVMYPIWQFGSEEQKHKWLPLLANGEKIGCFGLTEPNAGSDPASMETKARRDGDWWILNGEKQWISESSIADISLVWAKTGDKINGFLIERGTKGFTQTRRNKKGSMRGGDVGELICADCRVKSEAMLPKAMGIRSALMCLNQARYGISWGVIGAAMSCYETALNYAKERKQFGLSIASYQLIQEKLVKMLIEITKGQLLSYRLGRLMDENKARPQQISMAKKNNVTIARMCAQTAREILGANGISYEYPPIRHMANIESVYTYEGTDDMHTLIIGQDITGIPAFRREILKSSN
jgi:glutaryl-CoA dehydrogenase